MDGGQLALAVKHLGTRGPHGAAYRAGFRKGDDVVSFDGKTRNMTGSEVLAYTVRHTKPGQKIPVTVVRSGRRLELSLPIQE